MKIFVIGDSISIQYGPYLQQYLNGIIEYSRKSGEDEALKNLDIPIGANGGDSSMVRDYLQEMLENKRITADMILFNCGLHDIKTDPQSMEKQISPEEYEHNLQEIVRIINSSKARPVWLRTTPCYEHIHNKPESGFLRFEADNLHYNRIADKVMAENNVAVIDLFSFTKNIEGEIFCDHVHFVDEVRKLQAAFIAGWLQGHC